MNAAALSPRWVAPLSEPEWQELVGAALTRLRKSLLARVWSSLRAFAVAEELSLTERRRLERLPCTYELRLHTARGKLKARTVDLSLGGVKLHTFRGLRRGERVGVEAPLAFGSSGVVWGRVRHCCRVGQGHHTGIELELPSLSESWIPQALRSLGRHAGHFRQRREHVRARGPLLTRVGESLYGTLLDLSRGGGLLRTAGQFREGDPVRLLAGPFADLPPLPLEGIVLRTRAHKVPGEWLVSVRWKCGSKLLDDYLRALLRTKDLGVS